jgi:hypothetical protein
MQGKRQVAMGVACEERGGQNLHPPICHVAGTLDRRGHVEKTAPRLTLVEGGKED